MYRCTGIARILCKETHVISTQTDNVAWRKIDNAAHIKIKFLPNMKTQKICRTNIRLKEILINILYTDTTRSSPFVRLHGFNLTAANSQPVDENVRRDEDRIQNLQKNIHSADCKPLKDSTTFRNKHSRLPPKTHLRPWECAVFYARNKYIE